MRFLVMAGLALTVLSISHALTLSSRVSEEQLAIANAPIAKPATAPIKKPCEPWRVYEVVMAKGEEKPEIVERPLLDTRYPKGAVWVKNEGGRGGTYYPCEKTPEDTFNSVLAMRSAKEQADIAEIKRDLAKQSSQPSAPSPYPLVLSRDLFPPAADEYAPLYDPPASHAFDELQAIAAKDPPPLSPENARPLPQSPIDEEFVLAPARPQTSWDTITPDSYRPAPSANASFSSPASEPVIDWNALQVTQGDWDWGPLAREQQSTVDPYADFDMRRPITQAEMNQKQFDIFERALKPLEDKEQDPSVIGKIDVERELQKLNEEYVVESAPRAPIASAPSDADEETRQLLTERRVQEILDVYGRQDTEQGALMRQAFREYQVAEIERERAMRELNAAIEAENAEAERYWRAGMQRYDAEIAKWNKEIAETLDLDDKELGIAMTRAAAQEIARRAYSPTPYEKWCEDNDIVAPFCRGYEVASKAVANWRWDTAKVPTPALPSFADRIAGAFDSDWTRPDAGPTFQDRIAGAFDADWTRPDATAELLKEGERRIAQQDINTRFSTRESPLVLPKPSSGPIVDRSLYQVPDLYELTRPQGDDGPLELKFYPDVPSGWQMDYLKKGEFLLDIRALADTKHPVMIVSQDGSFRILRGEEYGLPADGHTAVAVAGTRSWLAWVGLGGLDTDRVGSQTENTLANLSRLGTTDAVLAQQILTTRNQLTGQTLAADIARHVADIEPRKDFWAGLDDTLNSPIIPYASVVGQIPDGKRFAAHHNLWEPVPSDIARGPKEMAIPVELVPAPTSQEQPRQPPAEPLVLQPPAAPPDAVVPEPLPQPVVVPELSVPDAEWIPPDRVERPTVETPQEPPTEAAAEQQVPQESLDNYLTETLTPPDSEQPVTPLQEQVIQKLGAGAPSSAEDRRVIADVKAPGVDLEVNFNFNSAILRDDSRPQLDALARVLSGVEFKDTKILIYGHTDVVGSAPYNLQLSQRRAEAVRNYLVSQDPTLASQLIPVGFGKEQPKYSNPYDPRNRRVQITVTK